MKFEEIISYWKNIFTDKLYIHIFNIYEIFIYKNKAQKIIFKKTSKLEKKIYTFCFGYKIVYRTINMCMKL